MHSERKLERHIQNTDSNIAQSKTSKEQEVQQNKKKN
jgi:hypothetical protein